MKIILRKELAIPNLPWLAEDLSAFGDRTETRRHDHRLAEQSADDHKLLAAACQGDAAGFFQHVADRNDRSRICGLPPTYALLKLAGAVRGEILRYDQAVAPDRTACVSFAAVALWGRG